jgi:hypothetical protein
MFYLSVHARVGSLVGETRDARGCPAVLDGQGEDFRLFWRWEGRERGFEQVVHYLDLYGPKHRHLYPLALRFLTSSEVLLNRHSKDVERVIEYVDREKIMPPLAILQLLSRNGIASVGLVKGWLVERLGRLGKILIW